MKYILFIICLLFASCSNDKIVIRSRDIHFDKEGKIKYYTYWYVGKPVIGYESFEDTVYYKIGDTIK